MEYAFSLRNGHYNKTSNHWVSYILVDRIKATAFDPSGNSIEMKLHLGEFGEADPRIVEKTGKSFYNIEISYTFGKEFKELGVVSEDGMKLTTFGLMGVAEFEWKSEDEMEAIKADGDPIDAPPGPYKIQPENLGKFIWLTGPPGLGKSTSAQLLGRNHGFAYYEADCFASCRNPYIPLDVPDPSMAQVNQRPLIGEGIEQRRDLVEKATTFFEAMMAGKEYDMEEAKKFYSGMCEDILRERKRIGGDFVVAAVSFARELRDHIRSRLGRDLVFVILDMDMEDVKKRVKARHHGQDAATDLMAPMNELCDPVGEDEKNAVSVTVTSSMSRDDVVKKILEKINYD